MVWLQAGFVANGLYYSDGWCGRSRWRCLTNAAEVRSGSFAQPAAGPGRRARQAKLVSFRHHGVSMERFQRMTLLESGESILPAFGPMDELGNGLVPPPVRQPVSVILLAGGVGSRMRADRPKQFLQLCGQTVSERSLSLFLGMPEVTQIIIVVEKRYREAYFGRYVLLDKRIVFADPGLERQDSVRSGLELVPDTTDRVRDDTDDILVCVHDSARPLVSRACIRSCLRDASIYGAAVIGVPCKATIKESEDGQFVTRTIERNRLWEIQTPQVIRARLLRHGFEYAQRKGLRVTDDVSVVEMLDNAHYPVKITMGEYANIKLTTPEDMILAEMILRERSKMNGIAVDGTHPECEDI
ncbi:hypothetical protein CCYA_CCYA13G3562 [Cyanidiococcus yangmingshanensis]|nr:hypothetical protein CCYA_CCYA13G3562 [Cyanidiococcus yangmingshanensis]